MRGALLLGEAGIVQWTHRRGNGEAGIHVSQDEIRGDWSNLKGTEYHLVTASGCCCGERRPKSLSKAMTCGGTDPPPGPPGRHASTGTVPVRMQRGQKDVSGFAKATSADRGRPMISWKGTSWRLRLQRADIVASRPCLGSPPRHPGHREAEGRPCLRGESGQPAKAPQAPRQHHSLRQGPAGEGERISVRR